jgi:lipoyl-dependent peroxiredoxin
VVITTIIADLRRSTGRCRWTRTGWQDGGVPVRPTLKESSMATVRTAEAHWEGSLMEGQGEVELVSSGVGSFEVSWPSRAEQANGKTSPEELIAAAHSSCFSMALSNGLAQAGTPAAKLTTQAKVTFQPGTGITGIHLTVQGEVPGLDEGTFVKAAEDAKANCPVSQALAGTSITLSASLA